MTKIESRMKPPVTAYQSTSTSRVPTWRQEKEYRRAKTKIGKRIAQLKRITMGRVPSRCCRGISPSNRKKKARKNASAMDTASPRAKNSVLEIMKVAVCFLEEF